MEKKYNTGKIYSIREKSLILYCEKEYAMIHSEDQTRGYDDGNDSD